MTAIDQLLSAYGIDAAELTVYAGGQYACIQRDPQPDEIGIRIDTDLRLMIVDLDTDPADGGGFAFEVWVASARILSYAGGTPTWEGGWTGTVTASTTDDPFVFRQVVAQQPATPAFIGEQVVTVQVIVTPGATPDLDVSYTFTVEDLTAPSLLTAEAIDACTIRLTFDDTMATSGEGSALLPEAYTVTCHNEDPTPGVPLTVTAVAEVAGAAATQFDLTVNWEQTPGCAYTVEVSDQVTDSAGNGVQ